MPFKNPDDYNEYMNRRNTIMRLRKKGILPLEHEDMTYAQLKEHERNFKKTKILNPKEPEPEIVGQFKQTTLETEKPIISESGLDMFYEEVRKFEKDGAEDDGYRADGLSPILFSETLEGKGKPVVIQSQQDLNSYLEKLKPEEKEGSWGEISGDYAARGFGNEFEEKILWKSGRKIYRPKR